MPTKTPNLDLYKVNGETDGNDTFNVDVVLNDNWDKIDAAVGNIKVDIPDASLTEKGIVQLSNVTSGTRENVAVTEKAVSDAALQAKSYTDQQISLVTETGIPKLVSYPLLVTATVDNQKVFEIPLDLFDANTDTLLVAINRAVLDSTQYTVTNTVRNEAGEVTQRAKITLLSGVASTSEVTMVVLKNVPIGPDGSINGAVLAANSVPINRVTGLEEALNNITRWGAL
ncbi:Phage tail fibre repeat-containing protein [Paenibacillus uliginis N3/975]|uniref:Phage tail fibre repeat-containing protein n=1 Tax=Paenibacillus uliginis N3/975 TaxID=1313296 RepID=A0A1X7GPB4_9BACL|nr:phage tail protein [Paenibacillus uliginis]SMF72496.1 Phage tail fibre repeat-containing protein [Paenibacillus uliginis N3/975]